MPKRKAFSKRDADRWRSMKLSALEKLCADPPHGFAEWYADHAREVAALVAEPARQLRQLVEPVKPELEAGIDGLGELEPWLAVETIRNIRAAASKRASKVPRKRPSPYAGELLQWRIKAAGELALHDDADVGQLAAAIKTGTRTKAADRYLRKWVSKNLAAITKQAERAQAARLRA